jgi:hypothetical protein
MADDLARLRECRSRHILYLCASPKELLLRKERDADRRRGGFDLQKFALEEAWYKKRAGVEFLDVEGKTPEQVERMVLDWLNHKWKANDAG